VKGKKKSNGEEITEKTDLSSAKKKVYPVFDKTKLNRCDRCLICYISCPDLAVYFQTEPFALDINQSLCKSCGICIEECPRKAILWSDNID
jgi:Pyruvate/2-oxoacid:ferredoxin oxidoreductase delta subunit